MSKPDKLEKPTLEAAMERLDAIVHEMEAGELPLEALIARYEEGIALSKLCREKLEHAEERIRILSRDSQGNPVLEEFEANTDE
ncbi:MAG: exodeoxyribonuclease VII small subunit [Chthoniobacterales bacterium]